MVYFMKVVTIRFICLTGKLKDCDICAVHHSQLKKKKKIKKFTFTSLEEQNPSRKKRDLSIVFRETLRFPLSHASLGFWWA